MIQLYEKPLKEYSPIFEIVESMCLNFENIKIGQLIKGMIMNFTVIEKTKNYVILRIESIYLAPQKRVF